METDVPRIAEQAVTISKHGSSSARKAWDTVRGRLITMLDVALGLGIGEGGAATMARQSLTLLGILIRVFADRLLAETRRGLPPAYLRH